MVLVVVVEGVVQVVLQFSIRIMSVSMLSLLFSTPESFEPTFSILKW